MISRKNSIQADIYRYIFVLRLHFYFHIHKRNHKLKCFAVMSISSAVWKILAMKLYEFNEYLTQLFFNLLWNFSWNWSGGKCPILGQVLPLKDIKYIDLPPCPCVENNPVVSTKLISIILQWNFYEFNFRVQLWTFVLLVWVVRQELY